ncbi:MAG: hypothetical protein HY834_12230 [Devosia nanyangense]|uniref:Uncharacterized protein n=1 Tax=Devosia nanyangense TaxID=1228055 RepID=A0A933L1H1_9HYPH|nr:hypothetical protein [Devosia nanyangense]
MDRIIGVAALLVGLAASPALATEWVSCTTPAGEASFDYLVGSLDVLAVAGLNISVGERVWASSVAYGPGDPVVVGQAFEDDEVVLIDAMDDGMSSVIAQLRLFKAEEGDNPVVYSGTLRIVDHGAWTVSCIGG